MNSREQESCMEQILGSRAETLADNSEEVGLNQSTGNRGAEVQGAAVNLVIGTPKGASTGLH